METGQTQLAVFGEGSHLCHKAKLHCSMGQNCVPQTPRMMGVGECTIEVMLLVIPGKMRLTISNSKSTRQPW